jgi:two-component system, cell cycle sensor histidine kinase and response regulator CckA
MKWVEIYSKTIQFQERSANLLTMIDITGRKQAEERLLQSQKMEAIGTLAGGIAHDVNNLLQIVLGHADMLLVREKMDEKSGKSVEAIRRAARNGAELVSRILTFSRKSEPEMRPINLSEEVRRVDELLRRTIPKMISLEMSLEDDLRTINADRYQIEQILLNLAANARDAMPEGGRLVFETRNTTIREEYCQTHPEVKPGKYVLLTVSDTGQGMPKEIVDRIFEPFFTTKQPGEGTGLGLSMVFGVVTSHGGHITCYSEAGVGSTFNIYFPVLAVDLPLDLATTIEMPAGGTETLLLVDDEDAVRTLGAEMLELAGYTVLTAVNGREALEVYRHDGRSISLVILDLVMPEMSGTKCLQELLKMDPDVKVLIASGYAANGPSKEARDGGAAGFITKPFDLKQILLAVRRSIDRVRKRH